MPTIFSFLLGGLMAAALLSPFEARAESQSLSGTVTYRERMALPPGAQVEVQLVDVSRADAPAEVLGETAFTPEGQQVPLAFRIDYDDSRILPGHSYALQARITLDGELLFTTALHHPVLTDAAEPAADILVQQVAATAPAGPVGDWLAEDIGGRGVLDDAPAMLTIAADGTVGGSGGCNRMFGTAEIADDRIDFSPLGSTMMACPEAVMEQEHRFFLTLEEVESWRIDEAQGKLFLLGKDGAALVVLTRHEAA